MALTPKKNAFFSRIETLDDAQKVVREAANGFLFVAALQGLIGFFLFPAMLIDAIVLAVLAIFLRVWRSRLAAVLLLLASLLIVTVTTLTKMGVIHEGGTNIFLAFLVLWAAIRAVQATFLLHGKFVPPRDPLSPAATRPVPREFGQ